MWVVGKLKLFIPRALYSLKRKISSVTHILDYKICEVQIFVLAWVEEPRTVKINATKNRKAENVGKFPIHLCFFRQIAIKWVVGKLKLLIPHALYSLKRKI